MVKIVKSAETSGYDDEINLANGPATEWKAKYLTTPDAELLSDLERLETELKDEWQKTGKTDPVKFSTLSEGYKKSGIHVFDPDSDDITATISGINLARAFRNAFNQSLKDKSP